MISLRKIATNYKEIKFAKINKKCGNSSCQECKKTQTKTIASSYEKDIFLNELKKVLK